MVKYNKGKKIWIEQSEFGRGPLGIASGHSSCPEDFGDSGRNRIRKINSLHGHAMTGRSKVQKPRFRKSNSMTSEVFNRFNNIVPYKADKQNGFRRSGSARNFSSRTSSFGSTRDRAKSDRDDRSLTRSERAEKNSCILNAKIEKAVQDAAIERQKQSYALSKWKSAGQKTILMTKMSKLNDNINEDLYKSEPRSSINRASTKGKPGNELDTERSNQSPNKSDKFSLAPISDGNQEDSSFARKLSAIGLEMLNLSGLSGGQQTKSIPKSPKIESLIASNPDDWVAKHVISNGRRGSNSKGPLLRLNNRQTGQVVVKRLKNESVRTIKKLERMQEQAEKPDEETALENENIEILRQQIQKNKEERSNMYLTKRKKIKKQITEETLASIKEGLLVDTFGRNLGISVEHIVVPPVKKSGAGSLNIPYHK